MIVIYHNPDSPNSNKCLEILETSKHDQEALDKIKLQKIIKLLKINPEELIRKESKVWKENFDHLHQDDHKFNNEELLDLMVEYQEIIERPIIINGEKAVIGKPAKRIFDIIPD